MHFFPNKHKVEYFRGVGLHILFHLKIFQWKLKPVLFILYVEPQGLLNKTSTFYNCIFSISAYNMEDLSISYQALGKEEIPP